MIEKFLNYKNNIVFSNDEQQISYEQMINKVASLRDSIKEEKIAICMSQGPLYSILFLAAIEKGIKVYPLNSKIDRKTLSYLKNENIIIYTDAESISQFKNYDMGELKLIDEIDITENKKVVDWDSYVSNDIKSEIVISTSGTTSKYKKFVQIPFFNMLIKSNMILQHIEIYEDDICLFISPLCFVQSVWTFFIHLLSGACLYFSSFNSHCFDSILEKSGATTLITVPAIIRGTINNNKSPYNLRLLSIGGDYMDKRLLEILRDKWPNVHYANVYGATETCAADSIFDPVQFGQLNDSFYSVGKQTEYSTIFITNEKNEILEKNIKGDICIQGPMIIDHYHNNEPIRNENGYFKTYDKGYIDNNGYLHYLGRSNSIIVSNGEKISACELESLIYEIEGVEEVLILGKDHYIVGQIPVAYIVSKDFVNETMILEYLSKSINKKYMPKEINFVDKLIKTDSGKIVRDINLYE